ncbi:putative AP2/ERF and B3 domain-containing transcription repressor RAV2 [Cocos nucifera]|nr:putative AP2/ERF and B3 domain-containing transcription repressor RAV2 [Cocos nucifera]
MMTEEEKQLATQAGTGDGLRVSVLDQLGRVYHMKLKKLHNSKKYFRFRGSDYHKFVKDNGLKAGEILETWAARSGRRVMDGSWMRSSCW